jgi:hypothetical protein
MLTKRWKFAAGEGDVDDVRMTQFELLPRETGLLLPQGRLGR